jgi:hypothetical protein
VSVGAKALARHLERPVHILEARVDSRVRLHGVLGVAELENGGVNSGEIIVRNRS